MKWVDFSVRPVLHFKWNEFKGTHNCYAWVMFMRLNLQSGLLKNCQNMWNQRGKKCRNSPESAPIGDILKSSNTFGRLRSFLVILATYNIVCSKKPVVEFDGLNNIFLLLLFFTLQLLINSNILIANSFENFSMNLQRCTTPIYMNLIKFLQENPSFLSITIIKQSKIFPVFSLVSSYENTA